LQLAISPQPRVLGESISVQSGSQLAVKVEGVIQHGKRPGLFRCVSGVVVTVSSQLQARSTHNNHDTKVKIRNTVGKGFCCLYILYVAHGPGVSSWSSNVSWSEHYV